MSDKDSTGEGLITIEQWWEEQQSSIFYKGRKDKDEMLGRVRERFYEPAIKARKILQGVVIDGLNLQLMHAKDFGFCVVITTEKGVVVIKTWADIEEMGLSISGVRVEDT